MKMSLLSLCPFGLFVSLVPLSLRQYGSSRPPSMRRAVQQKGHATTPVPFLVPFLRLYLLDVTAKGTKGT
jgi:hypothetical protein